MERCGADAVVAEGCEAGGHIGENTTMVLVPQIVDAMKIPVIAAGGIADGRGMAAAFMLGAKAVQLGTAFVATEDHRSMRIIKKPLSRQKDIDSRVTGRTAGHPVRALRNQMTKKYLELEKSGAGFERTGTFDPRRFKKGCRGGRCGEWQCHGWAECCHGQRSDELS